MHDGVSYAGPLQPHLPFKLGQHNDQQVTRKEHMTSGCLRILLKCIVILVGLVVVLVFAIVSQYCMMHRSFVFTVLASSLDCVLGQSPTYDTHGATYTNPVLSKYGADPFVVKYQDHYLMTYTTQDNVTISRSKTLT